MGLLPAAGQFPTILAALILATDVVRRKRALAILAFMVVLIAILIIAGVVKVR